MKANLDAVSLNHRAFVYKAVALFVNSTASSEWGASSECHLKSQFDVT